MAFASVKNKKRIRVILLFSLCCLILLIARLIYIQVIKGDYYEKKAYNQQTRDRLVEPIRGTIYDATYTKKLAQSISTNIVSAVPNDIKDKKEVAKNIAKILEMTEDEVLAKLNKKSSLITIKDKVVSDKAKEVLTYIKDEDITGIKVDEDTKRIYPYDNLLSHTLGFTGTDNQGLAGLEIQYEEELKGIPGKIIGSTDGSGRETPFKEEQYVAPQNGNSLVLTVDATVQSIVEKNLAKAVKENIADYGIVIVTRPKTGEILAIATYPDFNLNVPFEPNTDKLKLEWDTLSKETKNIELNKMWRNNAISNTAEPGSTFKIITSSAVLEEGIVGLDDKNEFNCTGSMEILGWTIRCWRHPRSHGSESLRDGIMNSCNPVFMQATARLGAEKYSKYLEGFNLKAKTGIDLPGEATGILHDAKEMTAIDLATTSFGQTIQITALQTAIASGAVANGGYIMKPYIVKEIRSPEGNLIKKTEPVIKKQIISKKTSDEVLDALYSTVELGTGKAAKVRGYTMAGKTGTAEEGRGDNKVYMASFVGITPVNDPEILIVMNLYNPTGPSGYQGGTICAPVVSNIADETLRYLDIKPNYTLEENNIKEILVPDLVGKTYKEAEEILKGLKFKITSDEKINPEEIIKDQVPKKGASIIEDSSVRVYKSDSEKQNATVPDVRGKTVEQAKKILLNAGFNIRIVGMGNAIIQEPSPGEMLTKSSIITVKFVDTTDIH